MQDLPHQYSAKVHGTPTTNLVTQGENLPEIIVAPPSNFGGPGDQWSPEELLMAAVADCLVLSFKAISRASKLEWLSIECESNGTLDKVDRKIQFTDIVTKAKLVLASGEDEAKAEGLLLKAEEVCFISNSLSCSSRLDYEIVISPE